jgi:ubiquinone/menaquinone biosynthesis C-methylase UbiE
VTTLDESGRYPISNLAILSNGCFSVAGFFLVGVSLTVLISFKPNEEKINVYWQNQPSRYWDWRAERISDSQWANNIKLSGEFVDFVRSSARDRVLDVGCGDGRFSAFIARNTGSQVVAIDSSQMMITKAKQYVKDGAVSILLDDGAKLLLIPSNDVDTIVMRMFLHNLNRTEAVDALNASKRVLKKDGTLIIIECVPFDHPESVKFFCDINNSRDSCQLMWSADVWESFLNCEGFNIERRSKLTTRISVSRWLDNTVADPNTKSAILSIYSSIASEAAAEMNLATIGSGPDLDFHVDIRFVCFAATAT